MKSIKILSIILSLIFAIVLLLLIVLTFNEQDLCLDTGFCKEGIKVNTQKGEIVVTQQTCIESNGTWIIEKKSCKFKKFK